MFLSVVIAEACRHSASQTLPCGISSGTPNLAFKVNKRSAHQFTELFSMMTATTERRKIWCQRRDSNSQTPVSKTGRYSNSRTLALWCTGEDLNLRVPLWETGLQPVRFGRAHAPVQTWRKVDESNAHRSSRCPGFQDQLPAIQQYLPHGGEYGS
jgi:hypothetical protein